MSIHNHSKNGKVHIRSLFTKTMITIVDDNNNAVAWASSDARPIYMKSKDIIPAIKTAAETAAKAAVEYGLKSVEVIVKGPGQGREAAIRAIQSTGLEVTMIKDVTPIPHNGCRPSRRRRVS